MCLNLTDDSQTTITCYSRGNKRWKRWWSTNKHSTSTVDPYVGFIILSLVFLRDLLDSETRLRIIRMSFGSVIIRSLLHLILIEIEVWNLINFYYLLYYIILVLDWTWGFQHNIRMNHFYNMENTRKIIWLELRRW